MTGSFARGAPAFNSMFFKPMMRKSFHKKASSPDTMRETALKSTAEEGTAMRSQQMNNVGENEGNCSWVPHESTGIYYPKGHEKVMDDVPPGAARDFGVINWFSETHG